MHQTLRHLLLLTGSVWHGCLEEQPKERGYVQTFSAKLHNNIHAAVSSGARTSVNESLFGFAVSHNWGGSAGDGPSYWAPIDFFIDSTRSGIA